jgi:crossover junction endodeoxyribonuclease RuvC
MWQKYIHQVHFLLYNKGYCDKIINQDVINMRILGIDPGLATVGFSVVDMDKTRMKLVTCGVISTPAHTSLSSRLDRIFCDMNELMSTFSPDVMSIEELFFNTNITTGISVAHARGVILLAAYRAGVRVYEYTPLQVKQAVVGYGRAEKNQVIEMVKRILNLPSAPKPDDAADAVALAICHARSSTSLLSRKEDEGLCSTI